MTRIRPAKKSDARRIAEVVAMAIGFEGTEDYVGAKNPVSVLTEVAELPISQYSYSNALVAEVDSEPAGVIVGYSGADLERLREGSLSVIKRHHPDLEVTDDETDASEFYIDSLGVFPPYRKRGIGRELLEAMIARAKREGHKRIGLLVDYENPEAERLYRSLGFEFAGSRPFFGHEMKHLVLEEAGGELAATVEANAASHCF